MPWFEDCVKPGLRRPQRHCMTLAGCFKAWGMDNMETPDCQKAKPETGHHAAPCLPGTPEAWQRLRHLPKINISFCSILSKAGFIQNVFLILCQYSSISKNHRANIKLNCVCVCEHWRSGYFCTDLALYFPLLDKSGIPRPWLMWLSCLALIWPSGLMPGLQLDSG